MPHCGASQVPWGTGKCEGWAGGRGRDEKVGRLPHLPWLARQNHHNRQGALCGSSFRVRNEGE